MKIKLEIIALCLITLFVILGCTKKRTDVNNMSKQENIISAYNLDLGTHRLATYSIINNKKYLVVFESGLGDGSSIWKENKMVQKVSGNADVLIYDRAGYGKSTINREPRNIAKLSLELENVINKFSNGRKVVLVAHSLGGMIVRDYAIKHPNTAAAILFIDPSHEMYNKPTQKEEDEIYNVCKSHFGVNHGATLEARELIEDSQYMGTLKNLPSMPVVVITNMKADANQSEADRQLWYEAHEKLKLGLSDFTHITTTKSGHYIMLYEPELVLNEIGKILLKLNQTENN